MVAIGEVYHPEEEKGEVVQPVLCMMLGGYREIIRLGLVEVTVANRIINPSYSIC